MKSIVPSVFLCLMLFFVSLGLAENYPSPNTNLEVMIRNPHWDGTIVNAHNGGILFGPQHTLLVYGKSCEVGADIVEVDVRLTADGHLIAFHDEEFDFVNSTGEGKVNKCTLAYVRTIRTRSLLNPDVPNQPIPTFREALQFLRERKVCLNVEPKDDVLEQIVRDVVEENMVNNVMVQAKSPDKARQLRQLHPTIGMIARIKTDTDVEAVMPFQPDVMEVDPEIANETLARIKSLGIKVQMDVGYLKEGDLDPKDWGKRLDRGINIAQTDLIAEMVKYVRRRAFNMGGEARLRAGAQGWTGFTLLNAATGAVAPANGQVRWLRVMMAGEGMGKLKLFRPTADAYQLIYETPLVPLRAGLNILKADGAAVQSGDLLGLYLSSGDVEANYDAQVYRTFWLKGDAGTTPQTAWKLDAFCPSADARVRQ